MARRALQGKKVRVLIGTLLTFVALGVIFVGPWPTYGPVDLDETPNFREAFDAIPQSAARSELTATPGVLRAGWAKGRVDLPAGTPLAGYGDREGRPSAGVHDDLSVRAVVLSDGVDTVAAVASDLLIWPRNVAEPVRRAVAQRAPLQADDILFNASHTHSGPGGFAPGWIARQFAGEHDPRVVEALVETAAETIVRAYEDLGPARLGQGKVEVPEHVYNRARPAAAVDPDLHVLHIEKDGGGKDGGSRLTVVSYAAHATVLGAGNMELSAGYPGALVRALERETGGMALFLAAAVGSMGPVAPPGLEGFAAADALGRSLAARALEEIDGLALDGRLDVASAGVAFQMPPFQVRWNRHLRLSPFLVQALGLDNRAWLQGLRVGNTVLVGTPSDFSGELSPQLKAWTAELGYDLWVLSFNGDYVGYVSPDRYYDSAQKQGREGYEMYVMNWCGPQQGEYLSRLMRRMVESLARPIRG